VIGQFRLTFAGDKQIERVLVVVSLELVEGDDFGHYGQGWTGREDGLVVMVVVEERACTEGRTEVTALDKCNILRP